MKYEDLGVVPIINACGTVTRLGGAPLDSAALAAYDSAAQQSVAIEELQIAVSQQLSQWLDCEAGLIASGAAAALTLGTAAILAGTDLARMEALPDTTQFPNELLIASDQRSGYDHAVRAAGSANAKNPLPILIPCHRVISSNGSLGGYGGGQEMKQWLLDHEQTYCKS